MLELSILKSAGNMAKIDSEDSKVGGLSFFLSLIALIVLSSINIFVLVNIFSASAAKNLGYFLIGAIVGALIAHFFIKGRLSVLIHEAKHRVISNLVGNKEKALKVETHSGHFEYAYSKSTARYNAFISLAPYWLPVATFTALILSYATIRGNFLIVLVLVGIGFGIDAILNVRDISPQQTDISLIRGGYPVGLSYIIFINLVVLTSLLAWVYDGPQGLKSFGKEWWKVMREIINYLPR